MSSTVANQKVVSRTPAFVLAVMAGSIFAIAQAAPPPSGGSTTKTTTTKTAAASKSGASPTTTPPTPSATTPVGEPVPAALPGFTPPSGKPTDGQPGVKVDDSLVVDLHVNDEDLGNVLEMLSIQSQRNIVSTKNVNARVTANLYGVTFYEALEAILHVNGFRFREEGNFIYVYTKEEYDALLLAQRQRQAEVIRLNYLTATDAADFVKPLLSDQGQIKANGKTENFPTMGDVPVSADTYANAAMLVVVDFEENIEAIKKMLAMLDTKPAQVLVEATILQAEVNESNAFGVDFSVLGNANFADFVRAGGPLNAVAALAAGNDGNAANAFPSNGKGNAVVSSPGNIAGPGTLKVGIVQSDVAVFLRALDDVTDTTVISNPKILALNRMPSRVLVGTKVGYVSTTSTDTATTQTVQFLDTGTQLAFRPFIINEKGEGGQSPLIRLELKPQVSGATIRQVQTASGSTITIPDEDTNELVTNVLVPDGQTVVLGGLFTESTTTGRRQVPVLGDIPIVGLAFRGHDDTVKRNEIIFLVTPTIMNEQALANGGTDGKAFVERTAVGARQGLLRFSRERLTGQMNVAAEQLMADGDNDAASWKLTQSLWINPNQPDALKLREKIDGSRKQAPSRSMLEQIIRGEKSAWIHADAVPSDVSSAQPFNWMQPGTANPSTDSTTAAAETNSNDTWHWASSSDQGNGQQTQSTDGSGTAGTSPSTLQANPSGVTNATPATANVTTAQRNNSQGGFFSGLSKSLKTKKPAQPSQSNLTNAGDQPMEQNK